MANYKVWNVRLRHVWLGSPLKAKRIKRRSRVRVGIQDALDRKSGPEADATPEAAQEEQS